MMSLRRLSILASAALMMTAISGVSAVFGDSSTPPNYIGVNFGPIITTVSYNYDFLTGEVTLGTTTATALAVNNVFLTVVSDPAPSDPNNGFGTFFGTARPVRFDGDTVVNTTSHCPLWPAPTCLTSGTLTFGGFVMVHHFGSILDQATTLATQYNIQAGDCGGGSPRFSLTVSNATQTHEIFVYIGPYPNFTGCTTGAWQSTGNFATDSAGLRWDTSQLCSGTFYNTYSGAKTCADSFGYTVSSIFLVTDGAWSTGGASSGTQSVLFRSVQINGVTRFP